MGIWPIRLVVSIFHSDKGTPLNGADFFNFNWHTACAFQERQYTPSDSSIKGIVSGERKVLMKLPRLISATALVLLMTPLIVAAQTVVETRVVSVEPVVFAKRTTLAVRYPVDKDTKIDLIGTHLGQPAEGIANIKHKEGRTRIELEMLSLPYPQRLCAFYTTCVLWAIAPEGQAERLAQLPAKSKFNIVATTSFQTFGLIITAEPHGMVTLPSPVIVAENSLRKGTKGSVETSQIEYRG